MREEAFRREDPLNPKNLRQFKPSKEESLLSEVIERQGKRLGLSKEQIEYAKKKALELEETAKKEIAKRGYDMGKEYLEKGKKPPNRPSMTDGFKGTGERREHWQPKIFGRKRKIPKIGVSGSVDVNTGEVDRKFYERYKKLKEKLYGPEKRPEP
ncbi:hypothetical protein ACFL2Q_08525 [Thermodesulfobacteriota bacterium]